MNFACSVPRIRSAVLRWSLVLVMWAFGRTLLPAQVINNWINPHSAQWEDGTNWSEGIRPASDQIVQIGNDGYKAVGISGATVSGFPDSLTA